MKRLVVTLALLISTSAFAQARGEIACKTLFAPLNGHMTAEQRTAIAQYSDLNSAGQLDSVFDRKSMIDILIDQDLPVFGQRLAKVIDHLYTKSNVVNSKALFDRVRALLKAQGLPSELIEKGIRENIAGDTDALRRLLGNLTFEETRTIFMGRAGGGTDFTPESLIGQYVNATGASVKVMDVPDMLGERKYKEKKLFVAVSEKSFPIFQKLFSNRMFMSSLGHGAILQGQVVTDVWGNAGALRPMSENTPLPMLILKTSEGERLHRYLAAATLPQYKNWSNALKQPWRLTNDKGQAYVQPGAYHCCTNFNGNIPIGDKLVEGYALPLVNEYGNNNAVAARQPIKYSSLVQWTTKGEDELKNIWTVPGHQQLSDVLGLLENNVNGEFASPGWVIQSLMGEASTSRVPVIFIFRPDHQEEIPDHPALHYEQPV